MNGNDIERTVQVIEYIEENLTERLKLNTISRAVNLSPYYIHRIFSVTTGMTIHDYLRRRQLTEAARMLSFSDRTIMDIALSAGYENQQSFSRIFKSMYKYSPDVFRKKQLFYPLQQRFEFTESLDSLNSSNIRWNIRLAEKDDIPAWMSLVRLVVDGYPFLNEEEHIQVVKEYIAKKQALIVSDTKVVIGSMLFSYKTGHIDFLGVHPLYRTLNLFKILLNKALTEFFSGEKTVGMTTYRKDDKADPGYRKKLMAFGFTESELLIEFGYPTQKFIFHNNL